MLPETMKSKTTKNNLKKSYFLLVNLFLEKADKFWLCEVCNLNVRESKDVHELPPKNFEKTIQSNVFPKSKFSTSTDDDEKEKTTDYKFE